MYLCYERTFKGYKYSGKEEGMMFAEFEVEEKAFDEDLFVNGFSKAASTEKTNCNVSSCVDSCCC